MKTLDQIEPRRPIGMLPFTIDEPGVYYVTTNLTAAPETDGITILSSSVTLDLGGFVITGGTGETFGVRVLGAQAQVNIRNGILTQWNRAIDASATQGTQLDSITARDNREFGLSTGETSQLRDCLSQGNGGNGIEAGPGSVLIRCVARNNGQAGIELASGGRADFCSATGNIGTGIAMGDRSSALNCSASNNQGDGISVGNLGRIIDCVARSNGKVGLRAGSASAIRGCSSQSNTGDGILVSSESIVTGNDANNNFNARDAAGIHLAGTDNRVADNHLTSNDRGISADLAGNLIIKNSAANNTINYFLQSGQTLGPIVQGGDVIDSTHPWANFEF